MGEKTASTGVFTIPTSPAVGTTVAQSGSANTYTAAYVQLSAAAPAAIFITGLYVNCTTGTNIPTYMSLQLATGAAASEVIVGQYSCPLHVSTGAAGTVVSMYRPIYPWIAVANGIRIAAKTASSIASALSWTVTLECINQANVVDDGTVESANATQMGGQTVTAANPVTVLASVGTAATATAQTGDSFARIGAAGASLTALGDTRIANLDAAVTTRMASYTQPTGFLAATFPATVASTTNITAGTITTATNLTNAPTAGDLTATMKTSVTTAASAATPVATVSGDLSATMKTSVTTAASAATPVATVSGDLSATMKTSVTTACSAATLSGDLSATMKTSVTTAASAATPVASLSGDLTATMKTSVTTACSAATLSGDLSATMKASVTTAATAATPVASLSGDLTPTMKTSVTTAASSATPVATVSGDLSATMKTSVTTAASAATPVATVSGDFSATMKTSLGTAVGTAQTGDNFARLGVAGVGLTNIGDARMANLNATVSSRLPTASYTAAPTAVQNRVEMDDNSTQMQDILIASGGAVANTASLKRLFRGTRTR